MKINNQNGQKIMVKRASLWAGVYHSAVMFNATAGSVIQVPATVADLAVAEFDRRFPVEVADEPETPPKAAPAKGGRVVKLPTGLVAVQSAAK